MDIYRHMMRLFPRMLLHGIGLALLLQGGVACTRPADSSAPAPKIAPAPVNAVVALGRLVPDGEVIKVSVSNAQDSRLNQIFVKEGDRVQANQVIALLQGVDRRQANLQDAEAEVRLRRAELERVRQGEAKVAEAEAQRAAIAELQAQIKGEQQQKAASIDSARAVLKEAELTAQRRRKLQQEGGISMADLNEAERDLDTARATLQERQASLRGTVNTLEASLRQAKAKLTQLREVRPVDLEIARVKLDKALIAVKQAEADLDDAKVRAPVSGQILRINTRIGEQVNTAKGIVELAQTQQMYAIAEVYETDVARVRPGQRATLSTEYGGFKGKLQGTVQDIGRQIGRKTLQSTAEADGPNVDQDARVVEVKIRLDPKDSPKVAAFTNMLVQATIQTRPVPSSAPNP
ncbi:HlyD family efflux transporter periplasmic adaptor subunit [Altericista sp. CCNU0014]|uniref:HlyD family efflux transporter periplasmic adaptor subunit n=1 Tax=Altericista sp. CCNU0014 TaxID=3082949 RepID=UPI00384A89EC